MTTTETKRRRVAVVAHAGKRTADLHLLREELAAAGVHEPIWREVDKSKRAPKEVRRAIKDGAELVYVWGGDGMVQRCADAMARTDVPLAIVPAGTANLLATNLHIPTDVREAVLTGLKGAHRRLDLGSINDEHFAVMAGTGLDALMIRDTSSTMKARIGRGAYLISLARHLRRTRFDVDIAIDGSRWFKGRASCVLLGNVGTVMGGLTVFDDAQPDDGRLEVGVATARGVWQWARVLGRIVSGRSDRSPLVRVTKAAKVDIRLAKPLPYELDGGDRPPRKHLRAVVSTQALVVCVPATDNRGPSVDEEIR